MNQERVERRSVSIYPSQWTIIDDKAAEIGQPSNTSAGLKAVIAEYKRLKVLFDRHLSTSEPNAEKNTVEPERALS